jgi:hypothetical protein
VSLVVLVAAVAATAAGPDSAEVTVTPADTTMAFAGDSLRVTLTPADTTMALAADSARVTVALSGAAVAVHADSAEVALAPDDSLPAAPTIANLDEVEAQVCRDCHRGQYNHWSVSPHGQHDIQCYDCHGALHSGTLMGCKRCHQAIHKKRFANWTSVTRFDDEDSADYMCMLCHTAHMSNLQETMREGCVACHGAAGNTAYGDIFHTNIATPISPMYVDKYAREQFGLAARLLAMPRGYAALIALGGAVVGYGLCFLVFLPFGYTTSAVWEFLTSRRRKTEARSDVEDAVVEVKQ